VSEQVETQSPVDGPIDRGGYDFNAMQAKWRPVWEKLDPFKAKDDGSAERRYALTMFSYPSGDLHMGHAEVFALHDVLARYWFQQGYDVLNPIGWDSFGLPAENAAIKRNEHPATFTYANIETQAESIRRYAISFDWSRRLHTSDPEYYRWTQWLFLRLYERGLAYRKASYVNWCPHDQTVLANEQVVQGRCERCGYEVTKRELTQWYFKTTDYAQRLLDDMDLLQWPEEILLMQRNWIGRSEGAFASFEVEGRDEPIKVFTTRPDTLFGATFMVVAPDAKLAAELVTPEQQAAFDEYLTKVKATTEIERQSTEREKTGVFLGSYAINPVTGKRIRSGPPTTCWPTTAPARSWPCPRTTSGTWTSPVRSGCRSGSWWTPASPTRGRPGPRPPAMASWSTPAPWTVCASRRPSRRSCASWRTTAAATAR
jgi:leucyl-tRNA synthetase